MAATLLFMAPVIVALLPRAEGVRRGRHADRGEGMKIAVVGGGSTYTPELVSGLSRERDGSTYELVLHDIDAERREVVGGLAARMLERAGLRRRARRSPTTSTRRSTAPTSCSSRSASAARRRGSRDETVPLACGCIGQETTGAGGFAKALRTVPVVLEIAERVRELAARRTPGSSTSRTRSGSSRGRCSTPATAPSGSATSRSASSARSRGMLGVEPARVVVDQVGLNHLTWVRAVRARRATTCCPSCSPSTATSSPTRSTCRGALLDELGAVPSYYLRYFYAHDDVLAEQQRRRAARAGRRRDRARAARALPRPGAGREAGAARAARRRLLQRGRARARRVADVAATATCTRSTSATAARSPGSPTTTWSRCRRASAPTAPVPLPAGAARARAARARPARRRVRAAARARGAQPATRWTRARRCSRIR